MHEGCFEFRRHANAKERRQCAQSLVPVRQNHHDTDCAPCVNL